MSVKLVIESSSDINSKEAQALGITMLPISITFGEEEFLDGVNLTHEEFYEKLIHCDTLPKTSMINAYKFEEAFSEHIKNGDDVVAIILSSELSGTYNAAKSAAEQFGNKVYVVNSLSASAGVKLLIEYALKLIKEGILIILKRLANSGCSSTFTLQNLNSGCSSASSSTSGETILQGPHQLAQKSTNTGTLL